MANRISTQSASKSEGMEVNFANDETFSHHEDVH
jgi:hypothetical protein